MKIMNKGVAISIACSFLLFAAATAGAGHGPAAYPGANGKPFQALQMQLDDLSQRLDQEVDELQAVIAGLQEQILGNDADILALEDQNALQDELILALRAALNALEQQVDLNSDDIAALELQLLLQADLCAALEAKVATLETRVNANESDIAALILMDQTLQQLIQSLQQQIDALQQQTEDNSDAIAALQSRLAAAEALLAGKQNRIYQACAPNYAIRAIYPDGSVSCEFDTTSSGTGTLQVTNIVESESSWTTTGFTGFDVVATCPSTHRLTGGGFSVSNDLTFVARSAGDGANGWQVLARGTAPFNLTIWSYAYCSRVQ